MYKQTLWGFRRKALPLTILTGLFLLTVSVYEAIWGAAWAGPLVYLAPGLLFCLAALALLAFVCRKDMWKTLAGSFQATLGVLAVCILLLGIAVARDFNAVFTKFHEIFFDNDLWLFDPATDYMIRMLPEGLFFDMVLRIGGFFLTGLGICLALSIFCMVRVRKQSAAR